jgi:hypothetical protein
METAAKLRADPADTLLRWPRLALIGLMGWWTLSMGSGAASWCFLDFANLAFHESGHLFFRPLGETMMFLGGTLGQLLVPALLVGWFLVRERKPFAAAFCLWWIGESLINVSIYMADARELRLPLVGGGDHDWNELFFRFGLLGEEAVARVSAFTHAVGVATMLLGLAWAVYFVLPTAVLNRVKLFFTVRWAWTRHLLDV